MEPTTNKIMTLDEAIAHAEAVAQDHRDKAAVDAERTGHFVKSPMQCNQCADEHEQLAKWLRHYAKICEIVQQWNDSRDVPLIESAYSETNLHEKAECFDKIIDTFRGDL